MKLSENDLLLLIIDVQEKLGPAMLPERYGPLIENLKRWGGARAVLDFPVVITEQYPKGLGPTIEPVRQAFEGVSPLAKTEFSVVCNEVIGAAVKAAGKKSILIAGMETHICVYQTARDLAAMGFDVHVLMDAVASRTEQNFQIGLDLIREAKATITSTETALFDLVGGAGSEAFKVVSRLVR